MTCFLYLYPDDGGAFDTWLPVMAPDEKSAAEISLELFEKRARFPSFIRLKKPSSQAAVIYFIHRTSEGAVLNKFV